LSSPTDSIVQEFWIGAEVPLTPIPTFTSSQAACVELTISSNIASDNGDLSKITHTPLTTSTATLTNFSFATIPDDYSQIEKEFVITVSAAAGGTSQDYKITRKVKILTALLCSMVSVRPPKR
jgi:hypothetical protein